MDNHVNEVYIIIKDIINLLILPFGGLLYKKFDSVDKKLEEMDKKIDTAHETAREVKITLIGIDGQNGLRSRVDQLERKLEGVLGLVDRRRNDV